MIKVFIDPGRHGCGVSIFADETLIHASYVGARGGANHPLLEVVEPVAELVAPLGGEFSVWIEKPRVYETAHQKGDQRDIVNLAVIVGALAAKLDRPTALFEPSEWKGQVPKEITELRAREALGPDEMSEVVLPKQKGLQHNVWDAVGMGLKFAGRVK